MAPAGGKIRRYLLRRERVLMALLAMTCLVVACSTENSTSSAAEITKGNAVPTRKNGVAGRPEASAGVERAIVPGEVVISSDRGQVTADLVENEATKALVRMLPLTITMRDHLQQEKTGSLPSPLPEQPRQARFSAGTIGLWGNQDFVIYYRNGRVPPPGIVVLGRVHGNAEIFDVPGAVTVRIRKAD